MKRTINHTGRKRIRREWISLSLNMQDDSIISFNLAKLELAELNLPPGAQIYVEAYYRTELKLFQFGTVACFSPPQSTCLTDMGYRENLKFRILVVDPNDKKILAIADGIAPEAPFQRKPILTAEYKDLGNRVWTIIYEGDGGSPILCINNRIPDIQNIAENDPEFFMQVYPSLIREVLSYMVFVEGVDSTADPSVDWHRNWLEFTKLMGVQPPKGLEKADNQFYEEKVIEWIENAVEAFCNKYSQKFEKFIEKMEKNL